MRLCFVLIKCEVVFFNCVVLRFCFYISDDFHFEYRAFGFLVAIKHKTQVGVGFNLFGGIDVTESVGLQDMHSMSVGAIRGCKYIAESDGFSRGNSSGRPGHYTL